jgi:hypothetical protein
MRRVHVHRLLGGGEFSTSLLMLVKILEAALPQMFEKKGEKLIVWAI